MGEAKGDATRSREALAVLGRDLSATESVESESFQPLPLEPPPLSLPDDRGDSGRCRGEPQSLVGGLMLYYYFLKKMGFFLVPVSCVPGRQLQARPSTNTVAGRI